MYIDIISSPIQELLLFMRRVTSEWNSQHHSISWGNTVCLILDSLTSHPPLSLCGLVMETLKKAHREELEREVEKAKRLGGGSANTQTLRTQQQ